MYLSLNLKNTAPQTKNDAPRTKGSVARLGGGGLPSALPHYATDRIETQVGVRAEKIKRDDLWLATFSFLPF